jgi:hypothetical protein
MWTANKRWVERFDEKAKWFCKGAVTDLQRRSEDDFEHSARAAPLQ